MANSLRAGERGGGTSKDCAGAGAGGGSSILRRHPRPAEAATAVPFNSEFLEFSCQPGVATLLAW